MYILGKCPQLRRRQNPCLPVLRRITNTLFFGQILKIYVYNIQRKGRYLSSSGTRFLGWGSVWFRMIQQDKGHTMQKTVRRRQFPVTAAYAFTDYRSQLEGQTPSLPYLIIDITSPPTGTLSLFNLYVALSRSSGRASIRLLRNFDDKLFMASHDPALVDEDERLEHLNIELKLNCGTNGWLKSTQSELHSCKYKSQIHAVHNLHSYG